MVAPGTMSSIACAERRFSFCLNEDPGADHHASPATTGVVAVSAHARAVSCDAGEELCPLVGLNVPAFF